MEALKLKIIALCNESNLPLEAILFIIRDIYRDVQETIAKEEHNSTLD